MAAAADKNVVNRELQRRDDGFLAWSNFIPYLLCEDYLQIRHGHNFLQILTCLSVRSGLDI